MQFSGDYRVVIKSKGSCSNGEPGLGSHCPHSDSQWSVNSILVWGFDVLFWSL